MISDLCVHQKYIWVNRFITIKNIMHVNHITSVYMYVMLERVLGDNYNTLPTSVALQNNRFIILIPNIKF